MGDSQHTPGPWKVTDMHPEEGCRSIRGPKFEYVAEVCVVTTMHGDNSDEVREANARLIAAAPALLEALERIGECLSPCVAAFDGEDMADVATEVSCALGITRAALAAALSDSPTPNTETTL